MPQYSINAGMSSTSQDSDAGSAAGASIFSVSVDATETLK